MCTLRAALAAAALCLAAFAHVGKASEPLTLDDAFDRVIAKHPDLALLRYTEAARTAEIERAKLAPALRIEASIENALGTGSVAGFKGSELSLSLASVLERGGKRDARVALAESLRGDVEFQREGKRLDLLAEVARRYLDALSARYNARIQQEALDQRERILDATTRRVRAGGTSQASQLAAEAARQMTLIELEQSRQQGESAQRRLALLWADTDGVFELAVPDLLPLPVTPDRNALVQRLANAPELRRFAHESRIREARLQLARTARSSDLDWQLGLRRLQSEDDWALLGSVSIPLGARRRAEPDIRIAEAELASLELERESGSLALESTLLQAWSQMDLAYRQATRIDQDLLPALEKAEQAMERAYRAGAISQLEWAETQTQITAAHLQRLEACLTAYRALIELQRLTGESFAFGPLAQTENAP